MEDRIAAVTMRNVTKKFGSVVANNNVSLDIYKGEILALLGENGSGKTTLMNMLSATAKERELTEEEHAERAQLRAEYVAAYKQSLVNHLNNVKIVDDKGNKTPLRKKTEKKNEKH